VIDRELFDVDLTEGLRSAGIFAMTFFWIDGHDMRIIEVDGVRVTALCSRFRLSAVKKSAAGESSDTHAVHLDDAHVVPITARNDTSENFYMHANFDSMMFDTVPEDLQLSKSVEHHRVKVGVHVEVFGRVVAGGDEDRVSLSDRESLFLDRWARHAHHRGGRRACHCFLPLRAS
jgi:hypothetical protein